MLPTFIQTVLLWAQGAFCLAAWVIWAKIFHQENTSKMFPFFCCKLHGNHIHLNLLVASNRNQLELAKALEKKKRERERLKRIEVVSQNWWTKMQQSFQKRLKGSQGTKQPFSHLCWLYFPLSANQCFLFLNPHGREYRVENGCPVFPMVYFSQLKLIQKV